MTVSLLQKAKTWTESTVISFGSCNGSTEKAKVNLLSQSLVMVVLLNGVWKRVLSSQNWNNSNVRQILIRKMFTPVQTYKRKRLAAWHSFIQEVFQLISRQIMALTIITLRQLRIAQSISALPRILNSTLKIIMGTLAQSTELDAILIGILLIVQSSYPALMIGQLEFGIQSL